MFTIKERRRRLRINNPASFGILCAMILVIAVGVIYAIAVGLVAPGVQQIEAMHATPSPTPTVVPATPTPTPAPTATPEPEPTLEPGATPTATPTPEGSGRLYGKTIGIDPARGYDSKVKGASTGVYANRTNFAVAGLVKTALEKEGAKVVLTYTDVKSSIDDAARAKVLNNAKVDAALRIDVNYVDAADTRGTMIWAPSKHDKQSDCDKLAKAMLAAYKQSTDLPERLYNGSAIRNRDDRDIFNNTAAPIVTLFVGHISNSAEDKLLNDETFEAKMAQGIVNGFIAYFG